MATLEREGAVAVGSRDALYHPWCRSKDGEMVPDDLPTRIASKIRVNETTGCWEWTGSRGRVDGYGRVMMKTWGTKSPQLAHRVVYTLLIGPIPEGMTIDHVFSRGCRSRACVNPTHLEPCTIGENVRRGARSRQTHCKRGHALSGVNLYIKMHSSKGTPCRQCRACARLHRKGLV